MIRDLDGAEPPARAAPRWLLPACTAACVLAFIGALVTVRPVERAVYPLPTAGGAVAFAAPSAVAIPASWQISERTLEQLSRPQSALVLPGGSFVSVARLDLSGVTGLAGAVVDPSVLYRYRFSDGREVLLGRYQVDLVSTTSLYTSQNVTVRGVSGRLLTARDRSRPAILTWADRGAYYQLVSAELSGDELVTLANSLR